ncbi:MAG: hypothetical protein D6732_09270, partial [Methanobacteriota archaeon]
MKFSWLLSSWMLVVLLGISAVEAQEPQEETNFKTLTTEKRWNFVKKQLQSFSKSLQEDPNHDVRKNTIINGNQIRVLLTNQGSISTPNADAANADLVWPNGPSGLGYAYE